MHLVFFRYARAGECYRRAADHAAEVARLVPDTYELVWAGYLYEAGEAFTQARVQEKLRPAPEPTLETTEAPAASAWGWLRRWLRG